MTFITCFYSKSRYVKTNVMKWDEREKNLEDTESPIVTSFVPLERSRWKKSNDTKDSY
jgi:hypothetical protein